MHVFIQTRVRPPNKKILIIKNTENIAIITKSKDKKIQVHLGDDDVCRPLGGQRGPSPRVMQSTDRRGRNRIMSSRTILYRKPVRL